MTGKKWLGLTLALAIAVGALLPFFAVYNPASHTATTQMSSLFGERMLICSGESFKWVKLADLQSGKEQPKPHGDKCPLCYMARHSLAIAAAAPAPAYDRVVHAPVCVHHSSLTALYPPSSQSVRAPPTFIS